MHILKGSNMIKALYKTSLIITFVILCQHIQALELGKIKVNSHINQPLVAEMLIQDTKPMDIKAIRINLAKNKAYALASIAKLDIHNSLQFSLRAVKNKPNYVILDITSAASIETAYLDFLVELEWAQGKLIKQVTILYDIGASSFLESPEIPIVVTPITATISDTSSSEKSIKNKKIHNTPHEEYLIKKNDTLWSIATQIAKRIHTTNQQAIVSIRALNPDSFPGNSVNINVGSKIKLPNVEDIQHSDTQASYHHAKKLLQSQPLEPLYPIVSTKEAEPEEVDAKEIEAVETLDIVEKKQKVAVRKFKHKVLTQKKKDRLPTFRLDRALDYDYIAAFNYFWKRVQENSLNYSISLSAILIMMLLFFYVRKRRAVREEYQTQEHEEFATEKVMPETIEEISSVNTDEFLSDSITPPEQKDTETETTNNDVREISLSDFFDETEDTASDVEHANTEKVLQEEEEDNLSLEDVKDQHDEIDTEDKVKFALTCIAIGNLEEAQKTLQDIEELDPRHEGIKTIQSALEKAQNAEPKSDNKPLF